MDIKLVLADIAIAIDEISLLHDSAQSEDNVRIGVDGGERCGLDDAAGDLLGAQSREWEGGPVLVVLKRGRRACGGHFAVEAEGARGGDDANEALEIEFVNDEIVG